MKYLILLILGLNSLSLQAVEFVSDVKQTPLIELYTSEGCSSCPPADRWLSGLRDHQQLWRGFVPVAFHVDYWDYIGWSDPFANPAYSQRQRRYAKEQNETTVYTPGLRKAGEEWRSWRLFGKPTLSNAAPVGKLNLSVDGDKFTANFTPAAANFDVSQPLQLNIASLGMALESQVTRGENAGKKLKHDFVVLNLSTFAATQLPDEAQANYQWQGHLPERDKPATQQAIAAWLTQGATLTPIQAVGGYLPLNSTPQTAY